MKKSSEMSLFNVVINDKYKDRLLTHLSNLNTVHINPKSVLKIKKKVEEADPSLLKIKELRKDLEILFKKLEISESIFSELNISKENRIEFRVKDLHELINHIYEEINFFLNRVIELDSYIVKAKMELDDIKIIKETYSFLRNNKLSRKCLEVFQQLSFKVYTTFSKNLKNLQILFDFKEFPNVHQVYHISEDRIIFYIIFPNDVETDLLERIKLTYAEEIPILKKYLTADGINFTRLNNEIDMIQNSLSKYEKEKKRIRDNHFDKFAAMSEAIQNVEEYNWAERQFEDFTSNHSILQFFVPIEKSESVNQYLEKTFVDKIKIESFKIVKNRPNYEQTKRRPQLGQQDEEGEDIKKDLREETPSIMKNFFLFRPYETLTKLYGVPAYSEIDPSPFLFFTFPLLFGLMFGDIGHGISLVIAGLIGGLFFKKKSKDFRNFAWIIFYCGWGTILAGLMYGEFFGSHEMFGIHLIPLFTNPLDDIMAVFKFTLLVGVLHINLGWFIQALNYWKQKRKYLALTDSGIKILLLTGGAILIFSLGFNIMQWLAYPFPILLPLIPGILLMLSKPFGRAIGISYLKKESYGSLMGEGSIEALETLLSVMSNVTSYVRLLALALAHISLMITVQAMLGLIEPPVMSENVFLYIIVQGIIIFGLIFGNLFVILIEGLFVFINAIRLHFYEFFMKFYQGSGIEFFPFYLDENYSVITFQAMIEKDPISEEIKKEIDTKKYKEDIEEARTYISEKYYLK